jgi:hypothetical protein
MVMAPDYNLDYCDNCTALGKLEHNEKFGGWLCNHCSRLAGRAKFEKPKPWVRRDHDILSFEPVAPPARKMLVAFDVDDTLFDHDFKMPDPDVVRLAVAFGKMENAEVIVWSYGGAPYAKMMATRMGLGPETGLIDRYEGKDTYDGRLPDLFVDDNGIGVPGGRAWLYVGDEEQV